MPQTDGYLYAGSPEERLIAEQALRWVVDPASGGNLLDLGAVRLLRIAAGQVWLRFESPSHDPSLTDLLVEDLEAELFDHFGGRKAIQVEAVPRPPAGGQRPRLRLVA